MRSLSPKLERGPQLLHLEQSLSSNEDPAQPKNKLLKHKTKWITNKYS